MTSSRFILAAALVAATSARAHGGSHPEDPNLHADPSVSDCEVRFATNLTQDAFRRFAREFGSISAFKQGAAPAPHGAWNVAVSVEYMRFSVEEHSAAWNDTFVHPDKTHELGSDLAFPKLKARVGVTADTDVGVYFAMNPNSNYGWLGFDVLHALARQSETMPFTVSVRGAYTKTLFIRDMDMHALSAGASIGHTFFDFVTPYLGGGVDFVLARPTTSAVALDTVALATPNALAGVEVKLWRFSLGVEAQLAAIPSTQLQTSFVF